MPQQSDVQDELNLYILYMFNSFHASGNFCRLLTTYANSLDPDQKRRARSGSKLFDTDGNPERFFFLKS